LSITAGASELPSVMSVGHTEHAMFARLVLTSELAGIEPRQLQETINSESLASQIATLKEKYSGFKIVVGVDR
jgi:trehalose-6-phosphate synthase